MIRFLALAPLATFLFGMLIGYFVKPEEITERKQENQTPEPETTIKRYELPKWDQERARWQEEK